MNHNYEFAFKRIKLRALCENDIEKMRVLRNENRQFFLSQGEITQEQQRSWFKSYLTREDDIVFAVELFSKPSIFIGAISVYNIDLKNGIAECGRTMIDKNVASEKGIGMEATIAACLFSFDILKLRRIVGVALKSNERIIKVDTRAGFRIIGDANENSYKLEMTRDTINLN